MPPEEPYRKVAKAFWQQLDAHEVAAMDDICDSQDVPANPITWLQEWAIEIGGYGTAPEQVVPFWQRLPPKPPAYLVTVTEIIKRLREKVAELSKKKTKTKRGFPPQWNYDYPIAERIVGKKCFVCDIDVDDDYRILHLGTDAARYFCVRHHAEITERNARTKEGIPYIMLRMHRDSRWTRYKQAQEARHMTDDTKPQDEQQIDPWWEGIIDDVTKTLRDMGKEVYETGLVDGRGQKRDDKEAYQRGYDQASANLQHELKRQVDEAFERGKQQGYDSAKLDLKPEIDRWVTEAYARGDNEGYHRGVREASAVYKVAPPPKNRRRRRKPREDEPAQEAGDEDARKRDNSIAEFLRQNQLWLQVGRIGEGVGLNKSTTYSCLLRLRHQKRVVVEKRGHHVFYHHHDRTIPDATPSGPADAAVMDGEGDRNTVGTAAPASSDRRPTIV